MTKDLKAKEEAALAVPEGGWDDGEFEAKDLLVPMICTAQGMSDVVKNGKVQVGDIYETVNKTVLGGKDKAIKFVPFKFFKTWVHCEMVETKGKSRAQYRSTEPYTALNANKYEWEETKDDGTKWRHYEVLNFYCLLSDEIEKGIDFPYLLSFRSSNKRKGRPLINYMARARSINPPQPLCSMTFSLQSVLTSNGEDSWFVFDVTTAGATPTAQVKKAIDWLNKLKTAKHTVDESGLQDELEEQEAKAPEPVVKKGAVEKEARY